MLKKLMTATYTGAKNVEKLMTTTYTAARNVEKTYDNNLHCKKC
jgi:hypothetical protein